MSVEVLPLGAGQDVGRSCCVVRMAGRTVMFDCGAHFGFRDHRRFPEFGLLSRSGRFTEVIDVLVITHFHTDHIGALPYFTEVLGYRGPILMTYPTFAIAPIVLNDYIKVNAGRPGDRPPYTEQHIRDCLRRVTAVDLHRSVAAGPPGLAFTFHYAGHVLGAAMVHCTAGHLSVLYTGDFNSSPDRHLGAAQPLLPAWCTGGGGGGGPPTHGSSPSAPPPGWTPLQPDVLISEATYAATLRDSKRSRERDFLAAVIDTVTAGGKVLIPTYAMGRAQELLMLITDAWERRGLQVPIYFSSAMASRALTYYTLLLNWTNANVRRSVFGAGAGAGARRAAAGVPSVAAAGAEGDAGSPGLEGGEEEEEEEDEEDKEGEEEEEEDDDLGAWGWGAWRAGLSEAAREGRGKAVGLGVGAVSPLPRGIVESSAIRRGGGGASISGRVAANGGGGSATGGVAVQAGAAGSGAPGPGAVPAAPAPASCGVFSEADVYGMFRTLPWDRSLLHAPGPALLFASPGNIASGVSLEAFRSWAPSPRNLVVLAGYQVRGTLGARLETINSQQQRRAAAPDGSAAAAGPAATVDVPSAGGGGGGGGADAASGGNGGKVEVRCRVETLAFSAHADLRGLVGLVRGCRPRAVVLVHGQPGPMEFLRSRIETTMGIPSFAPPTGTPVSIPPRPAVPLGVRPQLLSRAHTTAGLLSAQAAAVACPVLARALQPHSSSPAAGVAGALAHTGKVVAATAAPTDAVDMEVDDGDGGKGAGGSSEGAAGGGARGGGGESVPREQGPAAAAGGAGEVAALRALRGARPQALTALPLSGLLVARTQPGPPPTPLLGQHQQPHHFQQQQQRPVAGAPPAGAATAGGGDGGGANGAAGGVVGGVACGNQQGLGQEQEAQLQAGVQPPAATAAGQGAAGKGPGGRGSGGAGPQMRRGGGGGPEGGVRDAAQLTLTDAATAAKALLLKAAPGQPPPPPAFTITYGCPVVVRVPQCALGGAVGARKTGRAEQGRAGEEVEVEAAAAAAAWVVRRVCGRLGGGVGRELQVVRDPGEHVVVKVAHGSFMARVVEVRTCGRGGEGGGTWRGEGRVGGGGVGLEGKGVGGGVDAGAGAAEPVGCGADGHGDGDGELCEVHFECEWGAGDNAFANWCVAAMKG